MKKRTEGACPSPCPSPEALAKSLQTRLSAGEREALLDHLLVCPECRIRYAVLREVKAEIKADEPRFRALARESRRELRAARRKLYQSRPDGEAAGRARFFRRPWAVASAAGLVLILAGAGVLFVSDGLVLPRFRGSGEAVLKMLPPLVLSDGKTILFRWKPFPEADSYYFKIYDENLNMIRGETTGMAIIFHIDMHREFMIPGKKYVWSVEVHNDPGWIVARKEATFQYQSE